MTRAGAIVALCLAAALWTVPSAADFRTDCAGFDTTPLRRTKVVLTSGEKRTEISAEVALSDKEKRQGLMCRKNLADGSGMLFPYEKTVMGGFWMFNTYTDLDILYIASDGIVIETVRMKKCPRGRFENGQKWQKRCITQARAYKPSAPYATALELPAGYLKRKGFLSGKTIRAEWETR